MSDDSKQLPVVTKKSSFFDRTLSSLQRYTKNNMLMAWDGITGTARAITGTLDPDLPQADLDRLLKQMSGCLDPKGGEVSARRNTIELGETYINLSDKGKQRFLKLLAKTFDVNRDAVYAKIQTYALARTQEEKAQLETDLRELLNPPRLRILRQFNGLPEGIKFLVDMRADLIRLGSKQNETLSALEKDLNYLLSTWFDVGLLDMQEITWNSSASLLEKLIAYEAVHEIRSWNDLRNRLDSDRRCFAFFHYKMPSEPLIFVEVALVKGIATSIQTLLDESVPPVPVSEADTAIFYSISNTQPGLAGISFGNFLIKQVVDRLSREFPHIKQFATLSPIPGFRHWLDPLLTKADDDLLQPPEIKILRKYDPASGKGTLGLKALLATPGWHKDEKQAELVKPILLRLAAQYLLKEKKNGRALDPVAHFHLTNGSRLEQINWLADTADKGFKQSAGMMVNYLYQLSKIDDNHESYVSGKAVQASKQVKGLV